MIRRALGKTFASLRHRNFRLFFIGQTISNTGNWLTNVAMTLFVLKMTSSGVAVGLLAACQYGPILFLSAFGGVVADRYDKRRTLLITQSLEMCQSISLAIIAFLPHPHLGVLYGIALIGGVLLAFDNPLRRSLVTEMVPREDIPNAVVLYSTIINLSRIFGPTLAGLLAMTLGFGWCFTIDATSYLAVLVCLLLMRPSEMNQSSRQGRDKGDVLAGFRYIRANPVLWIPFLMYAAIGTMAYNFNVTLPLFVSRTLGASDATFTHLYSVLSFGSVVCAMFVAQRSLIKMRHILWGAVAFGSTMLLLSAAPSVLMATLFVFIVGMASIAYMTATTAIVQVEADPKMHGRVLSLHTVLMGGSTAIGGPILGAMADHFGARSPLVLGGIVCILSAVFGLVTWRRFDNTRSRPMAQSS